MGDGLSLVLQQEVLRGQELHICRHARGISHLLFTNDTLLLLHAVDDQARVIKELLHLYERCTGQY
jgi:hypothetical protein